MFKRRFTNKTIRKILRVAAIKGSGANSFGLSWTCMVWTWRFWFERVMSGINFVFTMCFVCKRNLNKESQPLMHYHYYVSWTAIWAVWVGSLSGLIFQFNLVSNLFFCHRPYLPLFRTDAWIRFRLSFASFCVAGNLKLEL